MGRRILAFFLGFIFAFVCIAGVIALAVFVVKVDQVVPETDNYLGDLAKMSVYDIGQSLYKLYLDKKTWKDETTGQYYSLGDFCKNYNIDLNKSLGMELPQEVLDIPAFEFFNDGGVENAMKQIKVSTLPAIANMFSKPNEDGTSNAMFADSVMLELAQYSMYDLLSNDEVGFAGVFANVRFVELLPDSFPAEDSDNKLMWAVGQTKIGALLKGVSGSENFMLQLKPDGAFETLGQLQLSALFGDSQYINALVGSNAVFADLIGDDGSLRLDDIINGISVGELLGCQKNDTIDITDYVAIDGQGENDEVLVKQKVIGEDESATVVYVKSINGEDWFEAELKCSKTEDENGEEHVHNADCFKYVWYSTSECTDTSHTHATAGDMYKNGAYYPRTEGLYAVLAALSITDLTSGNTDALMDQIKLIKISDIIDASSVNGIMSAFVDLTIEDLMNGAIDDMYLGEFFSFKRMAIQNPDEYDTENAVAIFKKRDNSILAYYVATDSNGNVALSINLRDWYEGKLECDQTDDESHVCNENCYSYAWYSGVDIPAEGVQAKLASKQISDLKHLNDDVQNMTLKDVFGEDKVPSMLKSIADVKIGELNTAINTIQLGDLLEYTSELNCDNEDEDHEHDSSCYAWYDKNGQAVSGMMAKLAGKTVNDISDLSNTIKEFTLRDVLGEDIPAMLKSLADVEIGNLNGAINDMYLGDFLEYEKVEKECNEEHDHTATCQFDWYKNGSVVEGMMAKLAYNKVSELSDLNNTVKTFTLRDVLGEDVPEMLLDVADTPVSEVGDAIQDIYLGSALGYNRNRIEDITEYKYHALDEGDNILKTLTPTKYIKREPNTTVWYEAVQSCPLKQNASHTHTEACFEYVWYQDKDCTTLVDGVVKAFVNTRVGEVDSKMQTVTLGQMGIGADNSILAAMQDTPINQIGNEINNLKMGVVLGYEKRYICGSSDSSHTHDDDCEYEWLAECKSSHSAPTDHLESDHVSIDGVTYYHAKGLNAKIADKSISEMTGDTLTEIALGLTMGDLVDGGMISLGDSAAEKEENSYKLALISSNERHGFTVNIGSNSKTFYCTLTDYFTFQATGANVTYKQYWNKCHENTSLTAAELQEHADTWKNLTLKNFISTLLTVL